MRGGGCERPVRPRHARPAAAARLSRAAPRPPSRAGGSPRPAGARLCPPPAPRLGGIFFFPVEEASRSPPLSPAGTGVRGETYFQQVFFFFLPPPPPLFFSSPCVLIILAPFPFRCAALDMRRLLQPCWWIFFLKITSSVLHDVVCFPGE